MLRGSGTLFVATINITASVVKSSPWMEPTIVTAIGIPVEAEQSLTVMVDKTLPVITGMPAVGCTLSPPKHQMVQVATVVASDSVSGIASFSVTATSSEPDSGLGGGDVPGDIVINGGSVHLRAEREPTGKGRTYTVFATATDIAGHTATSTANCFVPK